MKTTVAFILTLLFIAGCGQRDNTELFNKAVDLEEAGEIKKAIEVLTEALELNADDLECYNNRGWDYYELGDTISALKDFRRILEIEPNNTAGLYAIGFVNFEKGDYGVAIDLFEKVIELKGGGPIYITMTDNAFLGRAPLEADMEKVVYFKEQAEILEKERKTSPNIH